MEGKKPEYLYHVYKIIHQERESREYVAEGPGTRSSTYEVLEPINTDIDGLAKAVVEEHLRYLQCEGYNQVAKSEDLYMSFSFNPTCQKVMRYGEIYSAHPLTEAEQDRFCNNLKKLYDSLDNIFENDGTVLD